MSVPGWYQDPGGAAGRYRYWDGQTWSTGTAGTPRDGAPARGRGRSAAGWLMAVMVLVVVLVAATVLVSRPARPMAVPEVDPAFPTVTGWDDSSPTASPTPSAQPCPAGDPGAQLKHPSDGRVHGGNLSFAQVGSFDPPQVEPRFGFAHDVAQQTLTVDDDPKWFAQLAVGRLRGQDGFTHGAKNTAESLAQCSISGNLYVPYGPHRADVRSAPVSIGGRSGWLIESNVSISTPGLAIPGDHVLFIVVPDGDDWGMFFGAVPMGDRTLDRVLAATVADLRAG